MVTDVRTLGKVKYQLLFIYCFIIYIFKLNIKLKVFIIKGII